MDIKNFSLPEKLVSILIPVYNAEKYLDGCLNSVVNQTYRNLEILIYNDGSRDQSLALARSWAKQDTRIKVIDGGVNKGLGHARNVLMDAMTGEYSLAVDADDWISAERVEKMYQAIEISGADFVQGETVDKALVPCGEWLVFDHKPLAERLRLGGDFGKYTMVQLKMVRTSFLRKNDIHCVANHVIAEDVGFSLQVYAFAQKFAIMQDPGYFYRHDVPGQLTSQIDRLRIGRVRNVTYATSIIIQKNPSLDYKAAGYLAKRLVKYLASLRHISSVNVASAMEAYQDAVKQIQDLTPYLSTINRLKFDKCLSKIARLSPPYCFLGLKFLVL